MVKNIFVCIVKTVKFPKVRESEQHMILWREVRYEESSYGGILIRQNIQAELHLYGRVFSRSIASDKISFDKFPEQEATSTYS